MVQTVNTPVLDDTDTGFPGIDAEGEGWGNLRCQWHDGVCTETVEYQLEYVPDRRQEADGEKGEIVFFCPRHYVLDLAGWLELHGDSCGHPPIHHFASFGRVGNPERPGDDGRTEVPVPSEN